MDPMCPTATRPTTSVPVRWAPPTPPKGKSKGKGKAVMTTFGGVCHRCGRKDHKHADCFARVQVVDDAEG
eukprot:7887619-Heterocapsa_arctica.AAC.1